MLRIIVWIIVLLIGATWLGRKLASWLRGESARTNRAPAPHRDAEAKQLQRDPICGTFISPEISITLNAAGRIVHFCSTECREKYAALQAREVTTHRDAKAG
jgi:uncharacterized SAM-binding protein YcdF (DUF218 family)